MSAGAPDRPAPFVPARCFDTVFPFHFAFDAGLRITHVGQGLARLCPAVAVGARLGDCLRIDRPEGTTTFDEIRATQRQLFLLTEPAGRFRLRGQMLELPELGGMVFLGSPWLTDPGQLEALGMSMEDFALHDPAMDFLQLMQAQKMAVGDLRLLNERLAKGRAEVRAANEKLQLQNRHLLETESRLVRQEREARTLALIAARTDNAVVLTDAAGRVVWVNAGFTRLTGYTLEEMAGRTPGSVLQGRGTDPATVRHIHEQLRRGEGFSVEIQNYGKDGRCYWLAIEVQPIRDESGGLTNFMAIESDITGRRSAQQRLAIQYEVVRLLAESSCEAEVFREVLGALCRNLDWQIGLLWRCDGASLRVDTEWHRPEVSVGQFLEASSRQRFAKGVGLPGRVWASGRPEWIVVVACDANFPRRDPARADGLHGAFGFPVFVRGEFWGVLELFSRKIEEPDEALLGAVGAVGEQIGQRIVRCEAERALRETSALQRAILDGASYAIISTTPTGVIEHFNPAAERLLGYAAAEMIGRKTPAVFHDPAEVEEHARTLTGELGREVEAGFRTFVTKAELGVPEEREWTYIRKDGTRVPVLLSVSALIDESRRIVGYLGIASDLTQRKRGEEQLRATMDELERFNRLMLKREERVLELKREVNELRAKAGLSPLYTSAFSETVGPAPASP